MIRNNFIVSVVLLLLLGFSAAFAQSDRELVDNFKKEYSVIKKQIKDASSLAEMKSIADKITALKQNYAKHKTLLDKSLYPDKFDQSILNLNSAYILRQGDFATIDILKSEVGELKQQVEFFNQRNNELIAQVRKLEGQTQKDAKTIKKLENLIAELRSSIKERDELVLNMIDSLMPPTMREKNILTDKDKSLVMSEEEKQNVLNNVKTTISDNIRFMQITSLKPEDLNSIRQQQEDFANKWQKVGVRLIEVYADDDKKTEELRQIDMLFENWYDAVEMEAWVSISEEFSLNGIDLRFFNNGKEFTNSVLMFISDELKNLGVKSDQESKRIYANFADSTWFAAIQPVWVNYLVENKMLSEESIDRMESKIAEWNNALNPSNWWIYLVIAVVIIAVATFFFIRGRKPKMRDSVSMKE